MAEVQREPQDPFIKEDLEKLFRYVNGASNNIGALLVAVCEKEDLNPPSEELAGIDTTTQRGELQLDQDIAAFQHNDILGVAGLRFEKDVFSGSLCVEDGQKFANVLASIPESSEAIRDGLNGMMTHFLHEVAYQYIPIPTDFDKNTYETFHFNPQLQERSKDPGGQRAAMAAEVMLNADEIVKEFERLGASKNALRSFNALRTAELEGMVAEWAVAYHWKLFTPPTDSWYDSHWVQWGEERNWKPFFQYLDSAQLKAPADSKFMALVTDGMNDKITDLRNGVLEPTENPRLGRSYDDDLDYYDSELEEIERVENEKWAREYDALLNSVQQRLQPYTKKQK